MAHSSAHTDQLLKGRCGIDAVFSRRAGRKASRRRARGKAPCAPGTSSLACVWVSAQRLAQITNGVVKTQSANATLALGASPIMAASAQEQVDLARIPGGLLINFGTIEDVQGMLIAGAEANKNRKPVVFDPVGVGATAYRRETASSEFSLRVMHCTHVLNPTELLNAWQATVIKGNAAEIGSIARLDEVGAQAYAY